MPRITKENNVLPLEYRRDEFVISTDPARLDVDAIHAFLSERAYWALERPREVVARTIEHSLCYGLYTGEHAGERAGERQAGFARVVTDYATFAWICDVFVFEEYRGR